MERSEFSIFADALRTFYPKESILPNKQAMELWYREVCDIPYEVAITALRKWVSTNKWSPSIAELRETAATVANGEIPDWGEGWEQVCTAIRRYGYMGQRQALESMDELTRECVKRLGWQQLCMSENAMADRANFRTTYETLAERKKTNRQMALPLQQAISRIQLQQTETGFLAIGGVPDAE